VMRAEPGRVSDRARPSQGARSALEVGAYGLGPRAVGRPNPASREREARPNQSPTRFRYRTDGPAPPNRGVKLSRSWRSTVTAPPLIVSRRPTLYQSTAYAPAASSTVKASVASAAVRTARALGSRTMR
jgi:hypothetical protein